MKSETSSAPEARISRLGRGLDGGGNPIDGQIAPGSGVLPTTVMLKMSGAGACGSAWAGVAAEVSVACS